MGEGVRILLTGVTGQVGGALLGALESLGQVLAPTRESVGLSDVGGDFRGLRAAIRTERPRWIVNPAAYTAVDRAESEPELAYAINRDAVRAIGEEAERIGAGVIHFSTDYVFPGEGSIPYAESDATGPMNVYGASKLAGEQALAATGAAHMIFRTSWVYGATGKNFLLTILKLAREKEILTIVGDQHGAPTWSGDLAAMTASVMRSCEERAQEDELAEVLRALGGVYHAAGAGETTWHGFAAEAVRQLQIQEPDVKMAALLPIATEDYPTPAQRPKNSRLNCAKLNRDFGWSMRDWKQSLGEVLGKI